MLLKAGKADEYISQAMPFLHDELCGASEGVSYTHGMVCGTCKAWLLMISS